MYVCLLVWTFVHADPCECMWVHKVVHNSMQIGMIMCICVFLWVTHHEGMCCSWHSLLLYEHYRAAGSEGFSWTPCFHHDLTY